MRDMYVGATTGGSRQATGMYPPPHTQVAVGKLEKLTVFGDDYDTHGKCVANVLLRCC
jgi:UDP-glucose 4-epimerase